MAKILIVEDEEAIRSFIRVNLKRHNFEIIEAASGEEALEKVDDTVNIALLDVMLPGIDGFEVCRRIREDYAGMGIIMLTAKGQEQNKIEGLELGADDYMVKPFSPKELLARINALLRRISLADKQIEEESNAIHSGIFTILQDERKLLKEEQEIELTPIEFALVWKIPIRPFIVMKFLIMYGDIIMSVTLKSLMSISAGYGKKSKKTLQILNTLRRFGGMAIAGGEAKNKKCTASVSD